MKPILWLAPVLLLAGCMSPMDLPDGYRERTFESPGARRAFEPGPNPEPDMPERLRDASPLTDLSLENARRLALQRNHTAAAATAAVENAVAQIARARAAFLPTLDLAINQRYSDVTRTVDVGGGQSFTVQPGQVANGNAQFLISLFAFGRDRKTLEAARMNATTAALNERSARQTLLFSVSEAWYRIHEAKALARVARDALGASRRQYEDSQNIYEAGRVTKDQMLTARVNMLRNQQQLLVADNAVIQARRILNVLLDREIDASLTLTDPSPFRPVTLDVGTLKRWARNVNPDIASFRTRRKALELTRDATLRSFAPEIIGGLNATTTTFSGFGGVATEYFATLGAQWRPIDGGRRIGQLEEIHASLVQLRHQEIAAIQQVELDLERSQLALGELESQVTVARESVTAAEEAYRIVQSLFQNGRSTSRELLEQELTLSQSRAALSQALYQYRIELARVESLVGVSQDRWSEPLPVEDSRDAATPPVERTTPAPSDESMVPPVRQDGR